MKVQIFVEGAGNGNVVLQSKCRQAFRKLLESAGLAGRLPSVIPCGSRRKAYDDFCEAVRQANPGIMPILLVDSEEAVRPGSTPWTHLKLRQEDGWQKPANAADNQCHLMVQCMESWFLAEKEKLEEKFGQHFHDKSLPEGVSLEDIPKARVLRGLDNATRRCKHPYDKGERSFEILAALDATALAEKSRHAERFFDHLKYICR